MVCRLICLCTNFLFRYKNIMDDEILFISRFSIFLEYEGSSFVEWRYPDSCAVNNKSSPNAILTCRTPGVHKVKPIVSGSILRVWVMDPQDAHPSELNNTALLPSEQSRYFSQKFFLLGQDPVVQWSPTKSSHGDFDFLKGYWEVPLTNIGNIQTYWIKGMAVNFQDCFVFSSKYMLHDLDPQGLPEDTEVPLRLPQGHPLSVVWQSCFPNRALLLSDTGTFSTRDAFNTVVEIRVIPCQLATPLEGHFIVTGAVLVEGGILFLMSGSVYWRNNSGHFWKRQEDLPGSGVLGLQYRPLCWQEYPIQDVELSVMAVWTATQLYLGRSTFHKEADQALLKNILNLPLSYNVNIAAVAFGSRPPEVGVLVEACDICDSSDTRLFLTIYDEETGTWVQSGFLAKLKPHSVPPGPFSMRFMQSALPSVLLWNKEVLYYSFKNNSKYGLLHHDGSNNFTQVSGGSSIQQVVLDLKWNLVVKMENNALFYCKVGMSELVRLHMWEQPGKPTALYVNTKDQMNTLRWAGSRYEAQAYPLSMELKSLVTGTAHSCSYFTFQHSMDMLVLYLDMGEKKEFWASVVYPEGMGVNLQVFGYRLDLLHVETRTCFEVAHHICTKNMTITMYHQMDYSKADDYRKEISQTSGIATLELAPNLTGNTCQLPPNQLGSVLRDPQDEDLVVNYDNEKFGCLRRIHYKAPFLPSIDLYDGDTFLTSVDANFIIWEVHGRKDYSFNASMQREGCLREAQTWSSMLSGNKSLSSSSMGEAWGPHNYKSCFEVTPGVLGDLSKPYEILNSSTDNFITWSQTQSGIYVFNVKILDPNFSFCDLQAVFAVQTYGVITRDFGALTEAITVTFSLIVIFVLGCTYFRYVKVFNQMRTSYEVQLNRK
ncbi:cation channel sperm-associated auxiliary subunit epsilon-like [Amia ocellicauda]|uniref:cation channel sperm-associated auxiliary subunit epsilon-like n=1 Tax=Amia ocellicauda TaxID=2972642 RepID=UPI0034642E58